MTEKKIKVVELEDAVIRFAGDSGDGMQLAGNLFADAAALFGNEIATFPDYPAEIRAPHNTVAGVSGFQTRISNKKIIHQATLRCACCNESGFIKIKSKMGKKRSNHHC